MTYNVLSGTLSFYSLRQSVCLNVCVCVSLRTAICGREPAIQHKRRPNTSTTQSHISFTNSDISHSQPHVTWSQNNLYSQYRPVMATPSPVAHATTTPSTTVTTDVQPSTSLATASGQHCSTPVNLPVTAAGNVGDNTDALRQEYMLLGDQSKFAPSIVYRPRPLAQVLIISNISHYVITMRCVCLLSIEGIEATAGLRLHLKFCPVYLASMLFLLLVRCRGTRCQTT